MEATCGSVAAPPHPTHPETALGIYPNWDPNPALPRSKSNQSRGSRRARALQCTPSGCINVALPEITPPEGITRLDQQVWVYKSIVRQKLVKYLWFIWIQVPNRESWISDLIWISENFFSVPRTRADSKFIEVRLSWERPSLPHQSSHSRSRQVKHAQNEYKFW